MKKIFIVILTLFLFSRCYAIEYKYSEWSPIYPGEVKDKKFIFEENRYLWYKEVENDIRTNDINLNRRLECMEVQQANIITLLGREDMSNDEKIETLKNFFLL